jgi:hypothetical protein
MVRERSRKTVRDSDGGMASPLGHSIEEKGCKEKGDCTWTTTVAVLGPPMRDWAAVTRTQGQRPSGRLNSVGHWQVGPGLFFDFSRFSNTQILKSEMVTLMMSKFLQILQVDCLGHKEQLLFVEQLQNTKVLHVINSGINSNLNIPWILKGFKPF